MTDLNSELLRTVIIDLFKTKQNRKQKTDFYFIWIHKNNEQRMIPIGWCYGLSDWPVHILLADWSFDLWSFDRVESVRQFRANLYVPENYFMTS